MPPPIVTITSRDWSLHRKGHIDMRRHDQKVRDVIKGDLAGIIGEESIITGDDKKIVKVPIRSIALPHFRFGKPEKDGLGQGPGKPGDELGPPGDQPGVDYYEVDVIKEELKELAFADLALPWLKPKGKEHLTSESIEFTDIRRSGPMTNMDKRRTIKENIRRNAMDGNPHFGGIENNDLRYKLWEPKIIEDNNAVVIAMRDVSGSMGEFEKYITRMFYWWMVEFLRSKYTNVEIVFITHHATAQEVGEKEFFYFGESGGTIVSSAYELALKIIEQRYSSGLWNIYPFHFSDGDNMAPDNPRCVELITTMLPMVNAFGYGEIRGPAMSHWWGQVMGSTGTTTLMKAMESIDAPTLVRTTISKKEEVYPALRKFFTSDGSVAA